MQLGRQPARGDAERRNLQGKVIAKSAEADFATQRDVSRRKRDIETVQLKLLIHNPAHAIRTGNDSPEVYVPKTSWCAMNAEGPPRQYLLQNIVKRYGDFVAVAGITFEVTEGEIFGLLGPNGAGKSTLIRMMTTLTPATEGRATSPATTSHDPMQFAAHRRHSAGAHQRPRLHRRGEPSIYAKLYEVPAAERERNIEDLLEAVTVEVARRANQNALGRHASAARDCARTGAQPAHLLSGRAHHRS